MSKELYFLKYPFQTKKKEPAAGAGTVHCDSNCEITFLFKPCHLLPSSMGVYCVRSVTTRRQISLGHTERGCPRQQVLMTRPLPTPFHALAHRHSDPAHRIPEANPHPLNVKLISLRSESDRCEIQLNICAPHRIHVGKVWASCNTWCEHGTLLLLTCF